MRIVHVRQSYMLLRCGFILRIKDIKAGNRILPLTGERSTNCKDPVVFLLVFSRLCFQSPCRFQQYLIISSFKRARTESSKSAGNSCGAIPPPGAKKEDAESWESPAKMPHSQNHITLLCHALIEMQFLTSTSPSPHLTDAAMYPNSWTS